jgi:uncharacterized protein YbbC (DUF1343 family)
MVKSGLDRLINEKNWQDHCGQNIGYLCHAASIDGQLQHGVFGLKKIFGERLKCLFSPQHGMVGNVQDNMVETNHSIHPYFKLKIYSLYSETRIPTDEMLKGLDTVIVDLQDVGTRIYTYIYTMTLMMKKAQELGIKVVILDRPNPINGVDLEGNILDMKFASFVGLHEIPVRHALTMGEVALMANRYWQKPCDLLVVPMSGWQRHMSFEDTKLPWVLPSPNLATVEAAYTFVGTVLYEGCNVSEGRGTTRSLEIVGHPKIEAFSWLDQIAPTLREFEIEGCVLRPIVFRPTFQKHAGVDCGGFQIHVTDRKKFRPWRLCQVLMREFIHTLGSDFKWKEPPYEYEWEMMAVDMINGTDELRHWYLKRGNFADLNHIEQKNQQDFRQKRQSILIY